MTCAGIRITAQDIAAAILAALPPEAPGNRHDATVTVTRYGQRFVITVAEVSES